MRTWNIALIAFVVIFGPAGSTNAQRVSRPLLSGTVGNRAKPRIIIQSTPAQTITRYNADDHRYPYVIARPEDRQWIRATPIELRPNRPMHFWGNSRRRSLR